MMVMFTKNDNSETDSIRTKPHTKFGSRDHSKKGENTPNQTTLCVRTSTKISTMEKSIIENENLEFLGPKLRPH